MASRDTRPIKKLDEDVINRIAAGEVIQRPANALKELIENCLDAHARSIQVIVKEGGLKSLQIQDDGSGIRTEDLNIVCERFTTSKLQQFEDLQNIATYGFRGEALASISHIAHVTITTKTAESKCAYQVSYTDGKPKASPKACAGNQGTVILVEDLFFNVPLRRKAFQSHSTEYAKITDVVSRYCIHNSHVGFSLKKHGDAVSSIKTKPNSTVIDNVRLIFGDSVARELLEINCENESLNFKLKGYITSCNYSAKKTTFILFINHRLVESNSLRKAIDAIYSSYLQKHKFPFIYICLEIAAQNIDVNVHPTKQEVHFLHESSIIETIQKTIEGKLLNTSQSRAMYLQTVLPTFNESSTVCPKDSKNEKLEGESIKKTMLYDHNKVRTDSKDQKLDAFISIQSNCGIDLNAATTKADQQPLPTTHTLTNTPRRREVKLNSILSLIKDVEDSCDQALKNIFRDHTFVGCVSREHTLIQYQTKLYLINTHKLSQQLFYQIMLRDFGNFGLIKLSEPAQVFDLVMLALDSNESGWEESYGSKETLANSVVSILTSKADMLKDYFSMEIDKISGKCYKMLYTRDGRLCSIPYLLENYYPELDRIPLYILNLVTEVDWDKEKECFETFSLVTSRFYAFPKTCDDTEQITEEISVEDSKQSSTSWKWLTEHVLYAAFRKVFQPPQEDGKNGTILQIANLPELYKVFERC